MKLAVRPAALWTHAMFAVLSNSEKSGASRIDLTHDSHADLLGEIKQWLRNTSTSREGPWQRAQRFTAALNDGATETCCTGRRRQRRLWPNPRGEDASARVVIPTYQQQEDVPAVSRAAAVLCKAAQQPATRSGVDQRRQPITGRRVQERESQRPKDPRH